MSAIRIAGALAGASFAAVALAACAGGASASGSGSASSAPSGSGAGSSDSASAAPSSGGGGSGSFKDGTYTARGDYTSPGGASAVDVKLTLQDDAVTAVTVTPKAENPTAKGYEAQFASGVGAKVIGKKLSELNVTKVSGSSLTSQGFDRAVEAIEKRAAA